MRTKSNGASGIPVQVIFCLAGLSLMALTPGPRLVTSAVGPTIAPRYVVYDLGTFLPSAINSNCLIAGNSPSGPAVWNSGTLTPLAACPSGGGEAAALNNSGEVVGSGVFSYPTGPSQSRVELHACAWSPPYTTVVDLDAYVAGSFHAYEDANNLGYSSGARGVTDNDNIYGYTEMNDCYQAVQFAADTSPVAVDPQWDPRYPPVEPFPPNKGAEINSASGSHWCGDFDNLFSYDNYLTNGFIIDSSIYSIATNIACYANAINTNGIAVGTETPLSETGTSSAVIFNTGTFTTLPESTNASDPIPSALNNTILSQGTNIAPTPQIVGANTYTGVNSEQGALWDQVNYDGSFSRSSLPSVKNLNVLLQGGNYCRIIRVSGINDSGWIIGEAYVTVNQPAGFFNNPLAWFFGISHTTSEIHGVLLLPCQFRLLNGDTNTADRDGMDFSGNRPTTLSGTSNYNNEWVADIGTNGVGANAGLDVLGGDTNLGTGRGDVPGQCYTYSLLMVAKVSPASANVTYNWGRTYMDRGVTIRKITTSTNSYWYVQTVNSLSNPTGLPATPEWDTGPSAYFTVTPNPNMLCWYDNPAMNLAFFTACSTNDYAYEKADYAYYLTNSIGSTNAVATMHVGTKLIAKRLTTTGTIATDWSGISNTAVTTNIPDCSGVTQDEIRAIVGGTNTIILDQGVTNYYYVPLP